jgi:hypothetical protein
LRNCGEHEGVSRPHVPGNDDLESSSRTIVKSRTFPESYEGTPGSARSKLGGIAPFGGPSVLCSGAGFDYVPGTVGFLPLVASIFH